MYLGAIQYGANYKIESKGFFLTMKILFMSIIYDIQTSREDFLIKIYNLFMLNSPSILFHTAKPYDFLFFLSVINIFPGHFRLSMHVIVVYVMIKL